MRPPKAHADIVRSLRAPPLGGVFDGVARWWRDLGWHIALMVAEMRARRQEPELFNAARGRPAWQSSIRGNDTTLGPAQGTNGRAGKRDFFATEREARPWWMVELEADWPIHSIRIHGRRGASARSVTGLEVSISSDQRQWDVIHGSQHHFGGVASPKPLVIRLLDGHCARFVKLELPQGGELALNQVEVMVAVRHMDLFRVARRYDFAFEQMAPPRISRAVKPFHVENAPAVFDGRINAFHVNRRHGRFGNNLLQIGTAVCLAQHLGVPRVYLMKLPKLKIGRPIRFGDVMVLPERALQRDRPEGVLCGTFFHREQFGKAFGALDLSHIAQAARALGQPILRLAAPPAFAPGENDLAIHLRAGDIFTNPHPSYVQPPLAFYRLCVEFARAELGIDRVVLVYEDESNPCIPALKAWLTETGVPHISHSRTLDKDMAMLLAASHCVFGYGSFGLAIALLSRNLKTVLFPWLERRFDAVSQVTGARAVRIDDVGGGYIGSGKWRNTAEQRQMMLDYPIDNLRLRAD